MVSFFRTVSPSQPFYAGNVDWSRVVTVRMLIVLSASGFFFPKLSQDRRTSLMWFSDSRVPNLLHHSIHACLESVRTLSLGRRICPISTTLLTLRSVRTLELLHNSVNIYECTFNLSSTIARSPWRINPSVDNWNIAYWLLLLDWLTLLSSFASTLVFFPRN